VQISSSTAQTLRGLWRVLGPSLAQHKKDLLFGFLAYFLASLFALAPPFLTQRILDEALPNKDLRIFFVYSALALSSTIIYYLLGLVKTVYCVRACENAFLDLRTTLVGTVLRKPPEFRVRYEPGDVLTRLSNDIDRLSELFHQSIIIPSAFLIQVLVMTVFMLVWNWRFGSLVLLSLPAYFILLAMFERPITNASTRARRELSELTDTLMDTLSGSEDLRFHQQTDQSVRRCSEAASRFTSENIRSLTLGDWMLGTSEGLVLLVCFLPIVMGGTFHCLNVPGFSIGTIAAYVSIAAAIMLYVNEVLEGLTRLVQAGPLVNRVLEILEYPETPVLEMKGIEETPETVRLEFRNVCYCTNQGRSVLREFDLVIAPGEKVAIVGPSGAGKTTILNLLTRRLTCTAGTILLGGRDIGKYSLPFYLQFFALAGQNPHLFKMSIRENIALGWYHVPLDRIVEVARHARIHDFIDSLPEKYDTVIGAKGADFSGGQRQRLALARALVRDPEILLLDEFTSALDRVTEGEILNQIFELFEKNTIVCVTHSPAVASKFGRIIELMKG